MKNNIKFFTLTSVLFFVLPFMAIAQSCPFDISVEAISHGCVNQCGIKVTLTTTGGNNIIIDHPTNGAQLRIVQLDGSDEIDLGSASMFANWPIVTESSVQKKIYYGLNGGYYRVYARALCQGTTSGWVQADTYQDFFINNNYEMPYVTVANPRSTLICRYTGQISMTISRGVAPFTVTITSKPSTYMGTTTWNNVAAGTFNLENLSDGQYTIVTTDACGNNYTLTNIAVGVVSRDIPQSPIYNILARPSDADANCLRVTQWGQNYIGGWDQHELWYWQNSAQYYEWTIAVGRKANPSSFAYVTLPGTAGPTPNFTLIPNTIGSNSDKYVGAFNLPARYSNYGGFCATGDTVYLIVKTIGPGCGQILYYPLNTSSYICNTNVLSNWVVKVNVGTTCDSVRLVSSLLDYYYGICYPATWQVVDTVGVGSGNYVYGSSGTVVASGSLSGIYSSGLALTAPQQFKRKTYIIRIISGDGRIFEKTWYIYDPPLANAWGNYTGNGWNGIGTAGQPTGSRYFYFTPYADNIFWPGSTIEYKSFTPSSACPSTPAPVIGMGAVGSIYTIGPTETRASFYPLSPPPHSSGINTMLPAGTYTFEILAPANCINTPRTYTYTLGDYWQPPTAIDYQKQIACDGMRIYIDPQNPGTTVTSGDYSNRIRLHCNASTISSYPTTYWRIKSGPPGYSTAWINSTVAINYATGATSSNGRYLLLPAPGKYVIEASSDAYTTIFTTEVEFFEDEQLSVKATDVSAYICAGSGTGNIYITAKGGVPYQTSPFQMYYYYIIEKETNDTIYHGYVPSFSAFPSEENKKYNIVVKDGCRAVTVTVTMLDLANASVIWAENNGIYCDGGKIKIHSVALGDPNVVVYEWIHENTFTFYYGKDPDIDANPTNAGRYWLTVWPENCAYPKTDSINVTVNLIATALPKVVPVTVCRNTGDPNATVNLAALSGVVPTIPNGQLRWFDSNMTNVPPPTAVPIYFPSSYGGGQYTYYVSQYSNSLCPSNPVPVILNVIANCTSGSASVSPGSVCVGGTATVTVTGQTGPTFGPVLWGGFAQSSTMSVPLLTASNSNGALVVRFQSDGSVQSTGAALNVSCSGLTSPTAGAHIIPATGNATVQTCTGMVINETEPVQSGLYTYDWYKNSANGYLIVKPSAVSPPGTMVSLWGTVAVESCCDFFTIYDGMSTTSGTISGYWVSNDPEVAIIVPGTTQINPSNTNNIIATVQAVGPGSTTFSYVSGNGTFTTGLFTVTSFVTSISYINGSIICRPEAGNVTVPVTKTGGTTGGSYSISPSVSGVSINSSTGAVTVTSSAPLGTYTVTYSIGAGICPAFSTTTQVYVTGPTVIPQTFTSIPVNPHLMARFPCITPTLSLYSATGTNDQTICINDPIENIVYNVTGAANVEISCLPLGVTGVWENNVVTIQGTPTVSGTFNYKVTATGYCGTIPTVLTETGTIIINEGPCPPVTSAAPQPTPPSGIITQSVVVKSLITPVVITRPDTKSVRITGLPKGVSYSLKGNKITISGKPSKTGTFNYSVFFDGSRRAAINGTIKVSK